MSNTETASNQEQNKLVYTELNSGGNGSQKDIFKLSFSLCWIFYLVGLLLCAIPVIGIYLGCIPLLVGFIFKCILLHKLWSEVPTDEAKTTPGKAVGFLFIPFFNFYWVFVCFHGLAKTLNIKLNSQNKGEKGRVNCGLSMAYCVYTCLDPILFLGINIFTIALAAAFKRNEGMLIFIGICSNFWIYVVIPGILFLLEILLLKQLKNATLKIQNHK